MDTSSYVWVKPKRRRPPHPTAVKLLEITVDLLDEIPIDALSIAAVLERSGVSHGSLYHHYADFPDLVEQAAVHRYRRFWQARARVGRSVQRPVSSPQPAGTHGCVGCVALAAATR